MFTVYSNSNPSQLYFDAMLDLLSVGDDSASPRGKKILEIRPVAIEFQNSRNRVTFLKGRVINPFFQLAEALWILAGRSDVAWLQFYNQRIGDFSDDGIHFNAPYGERLRSYGKNDSENFIFCPIDQMQDAYKKLMMDRDTRQSVMSIYNPQFDHADKETKDRPCNLTLTFKIRHEKLDLVVFNRSNDLHWGVFGANLCQFATIHELMATWTGAQLGSYYQITDSLHIYVDDYGAGETDKILKNYPAGSQIKHFVCGTDPEMSFLYEEFAGFMHQYWNVLDPVIHSDKTYTEDNIVTFNKMINFITEIPDDYWRMTILAMVAFNCYKRDNVKGVLNSLGLMEDSQWKISCLRYLSKKYADLESYKTIYSYYDQDIKDYIERKNE